MNNKKHEQAYALFEKNFIVKTVKIQFKPEEIENYLDANMVEAYRNIDFDNLDAEDDLEINPYLEKNEYIITTKNNHVIKKVNTILDLIGFILHEAPKYIEQKQNP